MHCAGNHYVYLFSDELRIKNLSSSFLSQLAIKISHPKYGVGSDGLVLLAKSKKIKMRMFNANGSESAMCGNALCSAAKLLYERGIEKKSEFSIELGKFYYPVKLWLTQSSEFSIELGKFYYPVKLWFDKVQKIKKVTLQMGVPDLEMKCFINPKLLKKQRAWIEHNFSFTIKGKTLSFKGTLVSFNNPHLVIFCKDIEKIPLADWGAEIEKDALFPQGINIEFVQKINPQDLKKSFMDVPVQVWPRAFFLVALNYKLSAKNFYWLTCERNIICFLVPIDF